MTLGGIKFFNESSNLHAQVVEHSSANFESTDHAVRIRHLNQNRGLE